MSYRRSLISMENDLKWYVLKVVSGQEKAVKSTIDVEIDRRKLSKCIESVIVPLEKVYEVRAGKRRTRERNFFPGYILMHADLSDSSVINLIKDIPYAAGFLGERGCGVNVPPIPMREKEVNKILGKTIELIGDGADYDDLFIIGEAVNIIDGPFSGFSGTIQEIFEERKKLKVIVKIFERNTPLELGYYQTEKIK